MNEWAWNDPDSGKQKHFKKQLSQFHFVNSQILHGLAWDWTQASTVTNHLSQGKAIYPSCTHNLAAICNF
jgi:hypothetical protein